MDDPSGFPSHPVHWDIHLDREFERESERASVILGAALLDSALDALLKARLVASPVSTDALFDGANAPLGGFAAKIDMAYRLGLIADDLARALHLIRRIRNDFAHNVFGCALTDEATAARLRELNALTRLMESFAVTRRQYPSGPKGDFQLTVSFIQFQLRSYAADVPRLDNRVALRALALIMEHDDGTTTRKTS